MASRGDAGQAAREGARVTALTVLELFAAGTIEIGASAPVVAPLCAALLKAKGVVDAASRNKAELEELHERCEMITVQVIVKAEASKTSTIDVSPLRKCVDKLAEVAQRYHDQGRFARLVHFRKIGEDIQKLRARIKAVVPIMGLSVGMNTGEKLDQILARLQPRPKVAPVPPGVPMGQSWHTVRDGVVDRVYDILGRDEGPAVAALTGRSGAGKTTAAAAMVGERQGPIRPLTHENEDQARTRLDRLRVRFSDGVVYLHVGKGAGAADRLPLLMRKLAKALHEDVMKSHIDALALGETGESYVKKIVKQESLRCLVVADDVCEASVIDKLRETGMWVLLTTRNASMVACNERVVVDKLEPAEAENVLRGAANLPPGHRLCDDAVKVLEICGFTAMDIAFVGSWSYVRTQDNCAPKSNRAWARAMKEIIDQRDDVIVNAGATKDLDINRLAVLRTGFKYLARENPLAQELYMALTVFPDGYPFQGSDAAVLLDDEDAATGAISVLERWAVVRADASEKYRMHDAHVDFARDKLMVREDVRKPAVERWTSRISRLDFALGIDTYALLNMWHALERVGSEEWWVSRPYDDQLVGLDATDCSKIHGVGVVADLYMRDRKLVEYEAMMRRLLEQNNDDMEESIVLKMTILQF